MPAGRPVKAVATALVGSIALATACVADPTDDPVAIEVWFHEADGPSRRQLEEHALAFNEASDRITVLLRVLPEVSYADQVAEAAELETLPDLFDVDPLTLGADIAPAQLSDLRMLLGDATVEHLVPAMAAAGRIDGRLLAVPTTDAATVLFADRRALRRIDAPIPERFDEAWTVAQLGGILDALAAPATSEPPAAGSGAAESDDDDVADSPAVLGLAAEPVVGGSSTVDLGLALYPSLLSAGGDLVDRRAPAASAAARLLGSDAAVHALSTWRRWLSDGLVALESEPEALGGDLALLWGPSSLRPLLRERLGPDLVMLPLPDFGTGPRSTHGRWLWSIPATSEAPREAADFLRFLLQADQVVAAAEVNGEVPAVQPALDRLDGSAAAAGQTLALRAIVDGWAQLPPRSETGELIVASWGEAVLDVAGGADARPALEAAVRRVVEGLAEEDRPGLLG